MKSFKYSSATEPAGAVQTVSANQTAKFLAGGTNLIDLMKEYVERPTDKSKQEQMSKVVRVDSGQLQGVDADGVISFKGIPFAAPPVGELRWRPPQLTDRWCEDPRRKGENPDLVKKAIVPDVLLTSHVAALGIEFYTGKAYPKEYRGDAFVAMHGSWNRAKLSGYKIVRIRFKNGKLVGNQFEYFVTGWLPDENSNEVWGRSVGLLVLDDGSFLVTDNGARKIWRVSYSK